MFCFLDLIFATHGVVQKYYAPALPCRSPPTALPGLQPGGQNKYKQREKLFFCPKRGTSQSATEYSVRIGGGPFSPIFLKIGDGLDAQMCLGVVLYDKNENIF